MNRDSIVGKHAKVRGKGKEDVAEILEFDDNALHLLDEYLETRKDKEKPLFISRQRRRPHYDTVNKLAHRYQKLAGINKNVTTHVMRHTFGTDLDLNGMDIYGISKQMRHAKIETTKIYIHSGDTNKRKDYENYHTPVPLN